MCHKYCCPLLHEIMTCAARRCSQCTQDALNRDSGSTCVITARFPESTPWRSTDASPVAAAGPPSDANAEQRRIRPEHAFVTTTPLRPTEATPRQHGASTSRRVWHHPGRSFGACRLVAKHLHCSGAQSCTAQRQCGAWTLMLITGRDHCMGHNTQHTHVAASRRSSVAAPAGNAAAIRHAEGRAVRHRWHHDRQRHAAPGSVRHSCHHPSVPADQWSHVSLHQTLPHRMYIDTFRVTPRTVLLIRPAPGAGALSVLSKLAP